MLSAYWKAVPKQLKVDYCMEFLHLDRKAHVEIKCVSWIEIVKELVKIFKARPQNHANR